MLMPRRFQTLRVGPALIAGPRLHAPRSASHERPAKAALSLLAALVLLAGCASGPSRKDILHTGDPVIDGNAELAVARPQDRVLWEYRIAASALRAGSLEEAKAKLDDAILNMGGIIANSADAKKERSLFSGESAKTFIGEPYERVMAYYYRGITELQEGKTDAAKADLAKFLEMAPNAPEAATAKGILDKLK